MPFSDLISHNNDGDRATEQTKNSFKICSIKSTNKKCTFKYEYVTKFDIVTIYIYTYVI